MKKFCITFLLSGIIILTAVVFGRFSGQEKNGEFLRIHIRADSNDFEDQEVKYFVRDGVVAYLTPIVANATDKISAIGLLRENLDGIERIADGILQEYGFSYTATAELKKEEFPTRTYGEYTLDGGVYDCLILRLGSGTGDNWWCVVYPPLCFANTPDIRYKSLIAEQIARWKKER